MQSGAEYDNVLNHSVILCKTQVQGIRTLKEVPGSSGMLQNTTVNWRRCTCVGCVSGQNDADDLEQAGVYMVSPNNKLLHNVISNQENAVYVNQAASRRSGEDHAAGRVCASNQPIGETRGNTFKMNIGFGWYGNNLWPLQVAHSADGFVSDSWEQCHPFDLTTGADRHSNSVFEDHSEYSGNFGFGGYSLGDTTLRNFRTADSGATYWKTYHRAPHSGPFCDGCHFHRGMTGPGGDALVEFRNTTFGPGAIRVNHHCNLHGEATGGLCAPHYYVTNPILSHTQGLSWINEAGECATDVLLTYNGRTRFLIGDCVGQGCGCEGAFPVFDDSACVDEAHGRQRWRSCPEAYKLRTLKIYSLDRGNLTVTSDGVMRTVWKRSRHDKWSGSLGYQRVSGAGLVHSPNGYTCIVRDGTDVEINVLSNLTRPSNRYDHFVMDLGHHGWPSDDMNAHVRVTVSGDELLSGGPCWVHENASRAFITAFGGLISDAGEWVRCKREVLGTMWPLEYTKEDYVRSFRQRNPMWRPPATL